MLSNARICHRATRSGTDLASIVLTLPTVLSLDRRFLSSEHGETRQHGEGKRMTRGCITRLHFPPFAIRVCKERRK